MCVTMSPVELFRTTNNEFIKQQISECVSIELEVRMYQKLRAGYVEISRQSERSLVLFVVHSILLRRSPQQSLKHYN